VKWKEAKAAIAKRAPAERNKLGGAPNPLAAPKENRRSHPPSRRIWGPAGTTSVEAVSSKLQLNPLQTPFPAQSL